MFIDINSLIFTTNFILDGSQISKILFFQSSQIVTENDFPKNKKVRKIT